MRQAEELRRTRQPMRFLGNGAGIAMLVFIVALLAVPIVAPPFWVTLGNYIGLYSIVALGLVLLTGVAGQTSFGQAAFVGLGAYATAYLTTQYGASPWVTLPVGLALTLGWTVAAGLVFGLALSVASTVVLLRAMQARDLINTERGRIAVGWLIVEDLAMVVALVLLPPVAQLLNGEAMAGSDIATTFALTLFKVCGFIAFMLIVGRRVIPAALH